MSKKKYSIINKTLLITLIAVCIIACKTTATTTNNNANSTKVINNERKYCVGKGGGFTGNYEEYILYENGKVYKRDFNYDREIYVKQLPEQDLNYFLDKAEQLGLEGVAINEPGNISTYIEIKEGNLTINKIVWGANLYYPPQELIDFHKELFDKLSATE